MLKANFVALLVCVLACGALRTSAEITLLLMANGTSTLVRNETIPAPYLQKFGARTLQALSSPGAHNAFSFSTLALPRCLFLRTTAYLSSHIFFD